jgi:3-oxoacyl-[acyl-carrier protein] reductase
MRGLTGQVAVITGGARGIGLGVAAVLRGEGANVVVADADFAAAKVAAAGLGGTAHALAVETDVTDRDSVNASVAEATSRWGRLDIMVANAGIYPHIALADLQTADWDRVLDINTRGALYALQASLAPMNARRYGRIIFMSSITGSVVGQPGYAHYGASKAAMLGLMRSAALEVAMRGITVNAVLPGNIRTPGFGDLGPDHEQRMLAAIPLGVFGEPEDVGWAVRFLASPEARYITGQTLIIDGGQTLPESASPAD